MTDSAGKRRLRSTAQDAADVQEEGTAVMSPDLPPEVVEQVAKVLCEQFYGDALSKPAPNALTLLPAFLKLKTLFLEDTRCQVLPKLQHPSLETLVILADDTLATMCQPQLPALQQLLELDTTWPACKALPALTRLRHLRSLLLCQMEELTNIASLAQLTWLSTLRLLGCYKLEDIGPLCALRALTTLQLGVLHVKDIKWLSHLTGLQSLGLPSCYYLTNISPLSRLAGLTQLDLSACEGVKDTRPVADLPVVKGLVGEYKSPRVRAAGFGDS
ncbi:hypothetical protein WJX72_012544 [[Myrmecia] bisecta]|uniref:Uncharacterized protein n=1 Tax=[Myrmecia] bisecta TaxID=41462 RepID=A0AAW1PEJ4_9CHLO